MTRWSQVDRRSRASVRPNPGPGGAPLRPHELNFVGRVIEWRGPAPYYFVAVPDEEAADIREVAAMATYGWGVIPVVARIGEVDFETSLFPKDGGYLLPLKNAVRRPEGLAPGDEVTVEMTVRL